MRKEGRQRRQRAQGGSVEVGRTPRPRNDGRAQIFQRAIERRPGGRIGRGRRERQEGL